MLYPQELCALYWPDSLNCPEKMGSLSIEVVNEQPFEDYILRELKVTDVTVSHNYAHSVVSPKRLVHALIQILKMIIKRVTIKC